MSLCIVGRQPVLLGPEPDELDRGIPGVRPTAERPRLDEVHVYYGAIGLGVSLPVSEQWTTNGMPRRASHSHRFVRIRDAPVRRTSGEVSEGDPHVATGQVLADRCREDRPLPSVRWVDRMRRFTSNAVSPNPPTPVQSVRRDPRADGLL